MSSSRVLRLAVDGLGQDIGEEDEDWTLLGGGLPLLQPGHDSALGLLCDAYGMGGTDGALDGGGGGGVWEEGEGGGGCR